MRFSTGLPLRSGATATSGCLATRSRRKSSSRAASTGNPHLKAILPATTWMDNYSAVVFPGGILDKALDRLLCQG